MVSFKGKIFSHLEDVSYDGEDDNYEVNLTNGDSNSTGTTTAKRPSKKKPRSIYQYLLIISLMIMDFIYLSLTVILIYILAADNMEPLPLLEGKGKSLRVLGFSQSQRAAFLQILMRLHSSFWFMIMSNLSLTLIKEGFFHGNICSLSHLVTQ